MTTSEVSMDRKQAHAFLASLRTGDAVTLTRDGREMAVLVWEVEQ